MCGCELPFIFVSLTEYGQDAMTLVESEAEDCETRWCLKYLHAKLNRGGKTESRKIVEMPSALDCTAATFTNGNLWIPS